jgi:5-methylcytosine-specific restriction endonuclease McrA
MLRNEKISVAIKKQWSDGGLRRKLKPATVVPPYEEHMLCKHGCGREAKYLTKTNNPGWICSSSANCCPAVQKKQKSKAIKTMQTQRAELFASGELTGLGKGTVKRILRENVGESCSASDCGISSWKNKPVVLELHHIDRNSENDKTRNLQLLCPNCHSQTPGYCDKRNGD